MEAPQDPFTEGSSQFVQMAAAANDLRSLFVAYIAAGFTESQAMQLLLALMTGAASRATP